MRLYFIVLVSVKLLLEIFCYILIIAKTTNVTIKKISIRKIIFQLLLVFTICSICIIFFSYNLFLNLSIFLSAIILSTYLNEDFKVKFLAVMYALILYGFIQQYISLFFTDKIYDYSSEWFIFYNLYAIL